MMIFRSFPGWFFRPWHLSGHGGTALLVFLFSENMRRSLRPFEQVTGCQPEMIGSYWIHVGETCFFWGRLKMSRNVESKHAILSLGDRNNENMAMYQSQIRASGLSK